MLGCKERTQMWKTLLLIVSLLGVLVACRSGAPVPTVFVSPTPIPPASPAPTLWCGYEDCTGLLPYPTETLPPPTNISWTLTVEGVGFAKPVTYTYQDLTQLMRGVTHIPSAVPDWLPMPDDKSEWAGWEGVYIDRFFPGYARSSNTPAIASILFKTDDGHSVRLDNPWHGNAPVIALKNGEGEWLADDPDSPGPVRLIILGKPLELWVYRVTQIIFE